MYIIFSFLVNYYSFFVLCELYFNFLLVDITCLYFQMEFYYFLCKVRFLFTRDLAASSPSSLEILLILFFNNLFREALVLKWFFSRTANMILILHFSDKKVLEKNLKGQASE